MPKGVRLGSLVDDFVGAHVHYLGSEAIDHDHFDRVDWFRFLFDTLPAGESNTSLAMFIVRVTE